MTTTKLKAGGLSIKRKKLLGGPAPWPVLIWVKSTDQALDALQLVGGVFLCASFWGHGDRAGRHGGRVAGNLRCGIQGNGRHRAGRDNAVPFQLGPAAGHRGHGGGEQGAVRYRHGKGVGAVPESGAHCVQEGVPMDRRGSSRRCCRRCCHVRVRIREQTAKRRHGKALWRNLETECELQGWCWRQLIVCRHALKIRLNAWWYTVLSDCICVLWIKIVEQMCENVSKWSASGNILTLLSTSSLITLVMHGCKANGTAWHLGLQNFLKKLRSHLGKSVSLQCLQCLDSQNYFHKCSLKKIICSKALPLSVVTALVLVQEFVMHIKITSDVAIEQENLPL